MKPWRPGDVKQGMCGADPFEPVLAPSCEWCESEDGKHTKDCERLREVTETA